MRLLRRRDPSRPGRRESRLDLPTSLVGTVLVLLLLALHLLDPPVVEAFRLKVFDELQSLYPRPTQQDAPVVIVDIDDEGLAEIGQWPWPRSTFAEMLKRLHDMGARVITLDVLFPEADRFSPPAYARMLEAEAPELAEALRRLPDHDLALADTIRRSPVVLGFAGIGR